MRPPRDYIKTCIWPQYKALVIIHRQISASLSCQWPDFLHPSLSDSIFGRDLNISKKASSFENPQELHVNKEMACRFRWGAKPTTWTCGDIQISSAPFLLCDPMSTQYEHFLFAAATTFHGKIALCSFICILYFFYILSDPI